MKKIASLLVLVITLFAIGCGSDPIESPKKGNPAKSKMATKNSLILDGIYKQDDKIQLYYITPQSKKFDKKHVIGRSVKGSPNPQKIVFDIPANQNVQGIRLDFSSNNKQGPVSLNRMILNKPKGTRTWDRNQIAASFKRNKYTTIDPKKKTFSGKTVEGKYDPYIVSPPFHKKKGKAKVAPKAKSKPKTTAKPS